MQLFAFQGAETTAWCHTAPWPQLEGTSLSSVPGSAETPARAAWRPLTCCPARRCPSIVWMCSASILSAGLTERLFLSTDRSQCKKKFKKKTVSVHKKWIKTCWITVSFLIMPVAKILCPKLRFWNFGWTWFWWLLNDNVAKTPVVIWY